MQEPTEKQPLLD